ncbi:MAG: hypothetical protein K8S99_08570 [Planctomycetes bacterium]|nr:hypothetical protein [Planctomycetota bacterium]
MTWSPADLADAVEAGLRERARADDLEQAVYGFDALDELGLHPVIHGAFRAAGYGVWPEQRYPDDSLKTKKSEGQRCDVVLTHDNLPLREPGLRGTLFDSIPAVDPEEAYWLEIKSVAQFETTGPFRRYSAELFSPVAQDIRKLWSDSLIMHSGLLLVLLTANRETAEHDILVWHRRCVDTGFPVSSPALRGFRITERIGNGWCAAAVFGVRGV